MGESEQIIGIDFGTSYSKMAWYNPQIQHPEVIYNLEREGQTPSVVYFGEDNSVQVGESALLLLTEEQQQSYVITNIKRHLLGGIILPMRDRHIGAVDVVKELLARLKNDAE